MGGRRGKRKDGGRGREGGRGRGEGGREREGKKRRGREREEEAVTTHHYAAGSWDFVLHAVNLATHSMVKRYSIDCHEVGKVVLVRIVVPVPCNHIKGRVRLQRQRQQKCHITI